MTIHTVAKNIVKSNFSFINNTRHQASTARYHISNEAITRFRKDLTTRTH